MRPSPTYSPTARFKKNYFVEKPYLLSWVQTCSCSLSVLFNVNFVYSAAVDWTAEVEGEIELIF